MSSQDIENIVLAYKRIPYWERAKYIASAGLQSVDYVSGGLLGKLEDYLHRDINNNNIKERPPMGGLRGTEEPSRKRARADNTYHDKYGQMGRQWKHTGGGLPHYQARKLSTKGRVRNYRYKKQKGVTSHDLVQAMYPKVNWTMTGPVVECISNLGKQAIKHAERFSDLLGRAELQLIYSKIHNDICMAPQVNLTFANNHAIKNGAPLTVDSYKPSLQCLGYKRVFTFHNRGDNVAYIEFWEALAQDHTDTDFYDTWHANLQKSTTTTDTEYGLEALPRNVLAPTAEHTYNTSDPGLTPFKNMKALNKNWKLMKKTRYRLEPGTHDQHTIYIPGFTISHNALFDPDLALEYIKDISLNISYKSIGERCYDNSDGVGSTKHLSYMNTTTSVAFKDYTVWRARPRIRKSFRFCTNDPLDFELPYNEENYRAVAVSGVTAVPNAAQPTENGHDTLAGDNEHAAGAEMKIVDGAANQGDLL